ncbi:hypothetical protein [uncultured Cohaesibacter sp.]|uniref:hypothetical protein n=1 Tax=uncultured Cohaesibacter sp. TaxID=1002546 RepID=UPI0029C8423F|nr:hypothetical protein [uncultured Cohaesibacter sp.]
MPAPQQSSVPVYKETSNIPRPNTAYYMHNERDSAGYQLAKLLGVATNKFSEKYKENKRLQDRQIDEENVAHAQLGLEKINKATASNSFDLVTGDFEPDAYDMKQGQLEAADLSGQIRDAYMAEEAYNITDPHEFRSWLQSKTAEQVASARGRSPSYYNGFVKELGGNVDLLSKQYAGRTQQVIANKSATAFKNKIKLAVEADAATQRSGEVGQWLKGFLGGESAGNWNAWFGNSGSTEDLSQLTLKEILRRQDQPGNDAAGLIQIVPKTLRNMKTKYGYTDDTKFTPQVQTEMALYLMKEKGMDKWLRGELSDGAFADRLAGVWAAFKQSNGKGVYDGDGSNKATKDHSVTVSELAQLRALMDANPNLKKLMSKKDPKAGDAALVLGGTSDSNTASLMNSEETTGVTNLQAREELSSVLVDTVQNGQWTPDGREQIEEKMETHKLNNEQRSRVRKAMDLREKRDEIIRRSNTEKEIQNSLDVVLSGDQEAIDAMQDTAPKWHEAIVDRMAEADTPELEDATEEYLETLDLSQPDAAKKAFRAYLGGEITKDGLAQVVSRSSAHKTAKGVLKSPAINKYIKEVRTSLPASVSNHFDELTTAALNDLIEQSDGKRPPMDVVIETVDRMAQLVSSRAEAQQQRIASKYNL